MPSQTKPSCDTPHAHMFSNCCGLEFSLHKKEKNFFRLSFHCKQYKSWFKRFWNCCCKYLRRQKKTDSTMFLLGDSSIWLEEFINVIHFIQVEGYQVERSKINCEGFISYNPEFPSSQFLPTRDRNLIYRVNYQI